LRQEADSRDGVMQSEMSDFTCTSFIHCEQINDDDDEDDDL